MSRPAQELQPKVGEPEIRAGEGHAGLVAQQVPGRSRSRARLDGHAFIPVATGGLMLDDQRLDNGAGVVEHLVNAAPAGASLVHVQPHLDGAQPAAGDVAASQGSGGIEGGRTDPQFRGQHLAFLLGGRFRGGGGRRCGGVVGDGCQRPADAPREKGTPGFEAGGEVHELFHLAGGVDRRL